MTRSEKALTGTFPNVPVSWKHSVAPNQPAAPSTAVLNNEELDRFTIWWGKRQNGTLFSHEGVNISANLQTVMNAYEAYVASPAFIAWRELDNSSRLWQWRLRNVDVLEAVQLQGTLAPDFDPSGLGTAAPSLAAVSQTIGQGSIALILSSGGKSPEGVYGDDGDLVTAA